MACGLLIVLRPGSSWDPLQRIRTGKEEDRDLTAAALIGVRINGPCLLTLRPPRQHDLQSGSSLFRLRRPGRQEPQGHCASKPCLSSGCGTRKRVGESHATGRSTVRDRRASRRMKSGVWGAEPGRVPQRRTWHWQNATCQRSPAKHTQEHRVPLLPVRFAKHTVSCHRARGTCAGLRPARRPNRETVAGGP
jgi:hypothetical protein